MHTKSMVVKGGELYVGAYRLSELAEKYKTPLYVYDEIGIANKIQIFKKHFKSTEFDCEVIYASKAFLAPYMCRLLANNGFGIDAASMGDLYLISKSGFPANKIIFHGNNKSEQELICALDMGIEYIVVDSYSELVRLEKIARQKRCTAHTLFRINPGIHADTHAYIETSLLSSKFGESLYDEETLDKIAFVYRNSDYIKFHGFHAHIGSQITNPQSFTALAKTMVSFMKGFTGKHNLSADVLNLGGGFAIKYTKDDPDLRLDRVLTQIVKTTETALVKAGLKIKKLMVEPGRSLVGDSGFTLYKVGLLKKTFGGKKYAFIDGGMADNIRPALYQAKYTVEVANRVAAAPDILIPPDFYDVVGKCCESGDIIAEGVNISEIHKGDTIIVYSTGAYCYSMSMNYNGLQRGAVIFVNGKNITEAIRRESLEDLVATCNFEV